MRGVLKSNLCSCEQRKTKLQSHQIMLLCSCPFSQVPISLQNLILQALSYIYCTAYSHLSSWKSSLIYSFISFIPLLWTFLLCSVISLNFLSIMLFLSLHTFHSPFICSHLFNFLHSVSFFGTVCCLFFISGFSSVIHLSFSCLVFLEMTSFADIISSTLNFQFH